MSGVDHPLLNNMLRRSNAVFEASSFREQSFAR